MPVWVDVEGRRLKVEIPRGAAAAGASPETAGEPLECMIEGRALAVEARVTEPGVLSLLVEGRQYRCVLDGDGVWIGGRRYGFALEDPRSLRGRRGAGAGTDGPRAVKAPMPGRVVRVLCEAGQEIAEGQGLVVIEAMKMQNELRSPKAGRVAKVAVKVDDTVAAGDVLAVVE